jgi:hypothetical protein
VNAMTTALHTYLMSDIDQVTTTTIQQQNKTKVIKKMTSPPPTKEGYLQNEARSHTPNMSTKEKVLMLLQGIQHIISTLSHHQMVRSQQLSIIWYRHDHESNVLETICAAMNDSTRLSESIELLISDTIPSMIKELEQQEQQKPLNHRTTVKKESRHDDTTTRFSSIAGSNTSSMTRQTIDEAYYALQQSTNDLIAMLSNHAVRLSEQISMFLIRNIKIHSTIMSDFFTPAWENEWTNNELCRNMIQSYIHKCLMLCQTYLVGRNHHQSSGSIHHMMMNVVDSSDDTIRHQDRETTQLYLFQKVILNVVRAIICLYIRCLIQNKADPIALEGNDNNNNNKHNDVVIHRHSRRPSHLYYFQDPQRALRRMYDDIRILQRYFMKQFGSDHVTLQRRIVDEFSTLELVHECLLCCCNEHMTTTTTPERNTMGSNSSSSSASSLESFIVVIHKRCTNGNALMTRYFIGDLYVLMSPPSLLQPRFRFLPHINRNQHHNLYIQRITSIQNALQQLQPDLVLVTSRMKELRDQQSSSERHVSTTQPPVRLHHTKKSDVDTISSFHRLNCMLQSIYEERMSQGILPVLCHSWCLLPHLYSTTGHDEDDDDIINPQEMMTNLFIHPIRTITRTLRR